MELHGDLALVTSVGTAALLYEGGPIAHSYAKLQVALDLTFTCQTSKQYDLAKLTRQTRLIL